MFLLLYIVDGCSVRLCPRGLIGSTCDPGVPSRRPQRGWLLRPRSAEPFIHEGNKEPQRRYEPNNRAPNQPRSVCRRNRPEYSAAGNHVANQSRHSDKPANPIHLNSAMSRRPGVAEVAPAPTVRPVCEPTAKLKLVQYSVAVSRNALPMHDVLANRQCRQHASCHRLSRSGQGPAAWESADRQATISAATAAVKAVARPLAGHNLCGQRHRQA